MKIASLRAAAPVAGALVLVLSVTGCGADASATGRGGASASPSAELQPLIVDLDMDSSDVFTLAYVLNLPGYAVAAVTVSGTGVGTCPAGAANAAAIATVMGHPDVRVACGGSDPVGRGHAFPDAWRVPSDALYGISLPAAAPYAEPATELIARVLSQSDEPVDVLVVGPMTNVAQVLTGEPDLVSKIRRVVAMAGAVEADGNVGTNLYPGSPEWNVWADPGAAAAVLESGAPVVLVPLDATNLVPITAAQYEALAASHAPAGASLTYELLARNPFLVTGGQYWWDPLAATFLEREEVLQLEEQTIRISAAAGRELGRTMADPAGSVVSVAVGADPLAFEEVFFTGLRRGDARQDGWEVAGYVTVTYNGTDCRAAGDAVAAAGPYAVALDNQTGANAVVAAVTLHAGSTWADLQAFVDTIEEQTQNPDFADVVFVTTTGGLAQLVEIPAGIGGFACVELGDQGQTLRVVLGEEPEVSS